LPLRPIVKIRIALGVSALVLPALALIAIIVGVILFRFDVLDLHTGQTWLALAAAVGGLALGVLAVGRGLKWIAWRWMLLLALPALAPVAGAGLAAHYLNTHPSTAEVTTDLVDPPAFGGTEAAPFPWAQGAGPHPSVRSLTTPLPPAEAYAAALEVAQQQPGWTVIHEQPPETLQGTAVFGRFRYQRVWTVRVRPELGGGSLIDMRLRSRPGEPDLGDNARAVQRYLDQVANKSP